MLSNKTRLSYWLLGVSFVSAIMALATSNFIWGSGTAGIGMIILLILNFSNDHASRETWYIISAFLFSILGDWHLSNMAGDTIMFSKGIAMFFLAHIGYLVFALSNGRINRTFTSILLFGFLAFFYLMLYPAINDQILLSATLIYLTVSCLSLGAAVGMKSDPVVRWAYTFGIFLILFSDTIISLKEFLGYDALNFLILPTYYLAHISITFSLIRKADLLDRKGQPAYGQK
ncbi:lysoplasmalogenase [Robertkochia flava]|uniref:lysoplasmalogenase n=1 Tax=Robertkochia flava TaxID=3447986 RepID=UPI001CCE7246|nr:lysoplasmalogenase [Robertkochia marina]